MEKDRFKRSDDNDLLTDAKLKALGLLDSLLNFDELLRMKVIRS